MTRAPLQLVRRHALDGVSVAVLGVALYLLAQPGSIARAAWDRRRNEAATARALERHWPALVASAEPLSSAGTPLEIVEVSDYTCPYCRRVNPTVDSAIAAGARIGYVHAPNPDRPAALAAARAALCADAAGRFPAMHARLVSTTGWQRDSTFAQDAVAAGIADLRTFAACLGAPATATRLAAHRALSDSLRLRGTPTFLTAHRTHGGTLTVPVLLALRDAR